MKKIMITGYEIEGGKEGALRLGADEFFKKPIRPQELIAAIHKLLKNNTNHQ